MTRDYLYAGALVAGATGLGLLARADLAAPDHVMLYLLAIALAAAKLGRGPSLLASVLSVLAYDFFFVAPYGTFAVQDQRYLLTFGVMFGVALITSSVTSRLRLELARSRSREERMTHLYELSRELGSAGGDHGIATVVATQAAKAFGGTALVLLPDVKGALSIRGSAGPAVELEDAEWNAARWAFRHGRPTGSGTATEPRASLQCYPIRSGLLEGLGVLAIAGERAAPHERERRHLAEVFARQAALGLERVRLAETARGAALRAQTEEIRSSLLSSVSHDLRTPLGTITGAATMLRDGGPSLAADARADLVHTIAEEALRLERLVANLLEMTKLDSGGVSPRREWLPLEEVVGSALERVGAGSSGRRIVLDLPETLPPVFVDPVLFEQVLVNLFDNARKHTPEETTLEISASARDGELTLEVSDDGPGFSPGSEERVFDKFFRGPTSGPGAGLGLAICRGILAVHGGRISAHNRRGGGASFRIVLPEDRPPPAMDGEPDDAELRTTP